MYVQYCAHLSLISMQYMHLIDPVRCCHFLPDMSKKPLVSASSTRNIRGGGEGMSLRDVCAESGSNMYARRSDHRPSTQSYSGVFSRAGYNPNWVFLSAGQQSCSQLKREVDMRPSEGILKAKRPETLYLCMFPGECWLSSDSPIV